MNIKCLATNLYLCLSVLVVVVVVNVDRGAHCTAHRELKYWTKHGHICLPNLATKPNPRVGILTLMRTLAAPLALRQIVDC